MPSPQSGLCKKSEPSSCPVGVTPGLGIGKVFGRAWGSELVRMHDAGHINLESGHGEWPLGVALWQSLTGASPQALAAPSQPLEEFETL